MSPANLAWAQIGQVATLPPEAQAAYRTHVHRLPALILRSGLAAALLHTAALKRRDKALVLQHLAEHLHAASLLDLPSSRTLQVSVWEAPRPRERQLTSEALRALDWLRRFSKTQLSREEPPCDG